MTLGSLHGCHNLRKLQYSMGQRDISAVKQQLRTVSSLLVSEVDFIYAAGMNEPHEAWGDIDDLMMQKFPALSVVTVTWISDKRITWTECISKVTKALPKLHQNGILRLVLPPEFMLM